MLDSSLLDPNLPSLFAPLRDAERRAAAARTAQTVAMPTAELEDWRYSRIEEVDLGRFAPLVRPVVGSAPDSLRLIVTERAATISVVNGFVTLVSLDSAWAAEGLQVGPSTRTDERTPLDVSDLPTRFDALHLALAPDALRIVVPAGLAVADPIVVLNHHATQDAPVASFPHITVEVGENASLTVIELQTSAGPQNGHAVGGLSVPLVELRVEPAGRLAYATVADHSAGHWQLGRQVSSVGAQATLSSCCASFGGEYNRLRTDTRLVGRGAHGELIAVYYGDGHQTHDFRTFQHHLAQDTTSDLLFKGTVDDWSSSVYTGLIHIHPDGRGSNAQQTNRNIKLSDDAWAWSVPNLEIENSDVRCSHASAVSPIDDDQRFYLQARGVPPTVADRLIIAGFFEDVITRMPVGVHALSRRLVAAKLDKRVDAAAVA